MNEGKLGSRSKYPASHFWRPFALPIPSDKVPVLLDYVEGGISARACRNAGRFAPSLRPLLLLIEVGDEVGNVDDTVQEKATAKARINDVCIKKKKGGWLAPDLDDTQLTNPAVRSNYVVLR